MQLDGQKIIVTGGAAGIGGAISRLLAERGAKVVAVDINED
ncbi:oxidoreductase, partial [Brevibacterium paucivorans]